MNKWVFKLSLPQKKKEKKKLVSGSGVFRPRLVKRVQNEQTFVGKNGGLQRKNGLGIQQKNVV